MKDIFDECTLGDLKLKSRIVRTGTWERETTDGEEGYIILSFYRLSVFTFDPNYTVNITKNKITF